MVIKRCRYMLLAAFQLNKIVRKLVGLPSYRSQYIEKQVPCSRRLASSKHDSTEGCCQDQLHQGVPQA